MFAECVRTLEPGGRIAVNVANLGRKPYRSLSSDVIRILEDDLGLLLRGELIWQKAEGASGSCAWGSFRSAANPVLRDISERVIIASKGRFDRAKSVKQRAAEALPWQSTILTEDFMALTLDVWSIPPESARRVGHPAPFPVELPEQLIRLYTFADDLVLDPFMGSGSALVAAARLGRRYIGYDLDAQYVDIARRRVAEAMATAPDVDSIDIDIDTVSVADAPDEPIEVVEPVEVVRRQAVHAGKAAQRLAEELLVAAGFTIRATDQRVRRTGVSVSLVAADAADDLWWFDVPGAFTTHRGGLQRADVVWKALGRACALRSGRGDVPLVLLATHLPRRPSDGDVALRAAGPEVVFDAIELLDAGSVHRLARYALGGLRRRPLPGFWTAADVAHLAAAGDTVP